MNVNLIRKVLFGISFTLGLSVFALQPEAKPGEFVIQLKQGQISALSAHALETQLGGQIIKKIPNSSIVLIKRNKLEKNDFIIESLKNSPIVEIVEPNYIYRINNTPNDPKLSELWGLKNVGQEDSSKSVGVAGVDIGAEKAWDIETGSDRVVVAVIDTGVDYTHPDLKANIWKNQAELNGKAGVDDDNNGYVDDIYGYSFVGKKGDPMDDHGHGSHVSGTIGASGNDGQGIVGVNWKVQIMGLKFLSADGSGSLADALEAIKYATTMGVNVMSNSWGGGGASEIMKKAIEEANHKNIVFVAAAGNHSGNNDEEPSYPASYDLPNVISVAAADNKGNLAYFSCFGRKTVHVAAPGVNIVSSTPKGYENMSGTSMATPHVSGVVALLLAHEANLSPLEVRDRLIKTSQPLSGLNKKVAANGMVNAYYALMNQAAPPDVNNPANWEHSKDLNISTPHNYEKKSELTWEVNVDGANEFALHFSKFDTEFRYDKLTLFDKSGKKITEITGDLGETWSQIIKGNYVKLVFKSDDSVEKFGFDLDKVAWR